MEPVAKEKQGLSPLRLAFAEAYVKAKLAGTDFTHRDIALAAGYRGTPGALDVTASRVIRDPQVLAYMRNRALELMREGAIDAAIALRELTAQRDDKRTRLDAARLLGGAIGLMAPEQSIGSGPALVINLHLPGAPLTQPAPVASQVIDHAPQSSTDPHCDEEALALRLGSPSPSAPAAAPDQAPRRGGGAGFAKRARGGGRPPQAEVPKSAGRPRAASSKSPGVGKGGASKVPEVVRLSRKNSRLPKVAK